MHIFSFFLVYFKSSYVKVQNKKEAFRFLLLNQIYIYLKSIIIKKFKNEK